MAAPSDVSGLTAEYYDAAGNLTLDITEAAVGVLTYGDRTTGEIRSVRVEVDPDAIVA